jgi:epoxyqueuosine reductase
VRRHLADPSPLVRAMAVWALSQLMPPNDFAELAAACADAEHDVSVAEEWRCGRR